MQQALSRPKLISLAAGFTDNPSLPVEEARELAANLFAGDQSARRALQYGSTNGDPKLLKLTARRLHEQDRAALKPGRLPAGADYSPDRMLMTHGSQQFLYLLAEALFDPGDIILVEAPTYFVFLGMAGSLGVRCRNVRMLPEGVDANDLDRVLKELARSGELPRVKALYLVSYFQNPTGRTTSLSTKAAALEVLDAYERRAGHPLYLIEDAAYRELRFAGPDTPSALTLPGATDRVIYTGTYSKPFATGIRVGFGILPGPLFEVLSCIKGNHDFGTAHLLQKLLADALETGVFDRHLTRLQARYREKAAVLGGALRDYCGDAMTWDTPAGGLYYWTRLKGRRRSGPRSKLFTTALRQNVLYVPGAFCYAQDSTGRNPDNEMRLSFGNASGNEMTEGARRLGRALR